MSSTQSHLPWLEPGQAFPTTSHAWGLDSPAPGLLAAGADLGVDTLVQAYRCGIFPWFSEGQPILWWSPNPRMALKVQDFKLHRSLRRVLTRFREAHHCEIRFDTAFAQVIRACANTPREGQPGTWIVPDMVAAYQRLYEAGIAHSVETWVNGELVGGLYCVSVGHAVFGESMFSVATDASKVALAALVAFCRHSGIQLIDCQQNTRHLASLGAAEIPRDQFLSLVRRESTLAAPSWQFDPLYWDLLLKNTSTHR